MTKRIGLLLCLLAALCFGAAACDGDGNGPTDTTTDDAPTDPTTDPTTDDASTADGYPATMPPVECDNDPCTWTGCPELPPEGDPVSVRLVLADFSEDFPVENAYIDVFLGNVVTGAPDFELGPTDAEGRTEEFTANANSVFAYRVNASTEIPFPPGEIKATIEYGQPVPAAGGDIDTIAVSRQTYQLIPTVLGIPPSAGLGILAGAFEDCGGIEVEGIVARLFASGSTTPCKNEPVNCMDRYFVDETPARDQLWSSADGLYGILEIPPGSGYRLELHGKVAGSTCPAEMEIMATLPDIEILPDAISIVDATADTAADHVCLW